MHSVPVLVDGDFVLTESRAVAAYVANTYDKTGQLYPTDPKVRARVDSRLYFDMGTFYHAFGETVYPLMLKDEKVAPAKFDRLKEVLGWANDFVKETGYVAGTDYNCLCIGFFSKTNQRALLTFWFFKSIY